MALNRERPHLLVLPEDDATRSLATGFVDCTQGQMQVLPPVRGWSHVLEEFKNTHIAELRKYPLRHLVLLIDFDNNFTNRLPQFRDAMPLDVADRVYVLGARGEAEDLKRQTTLGRGKLSLIGQELARECEQGQHNLWSSTPQLAHNCPEVQRLHSAVRDFLF